MNDTQKIILFDGICNLCSGMVQFTLKRDRQEKFKFASLQSASGQALLTKFGLSKEDFDSFVYIDGNRYFQKSSASLRVFKELSGGWKLLFVFIIVPTFIRDFVYNRISKNRYKIFGKKDSCMVPTPEIKNRFLE